MRDMKEYAEIQLAESVVYDVTGFLDVNDVVSAIEDIESEFDGDSYCPYYSQQDDVINDYEREFGNDAEDICGDKQYSATDWQQAKTAYAYAIAYTAFGYYFSEAKQELIDGIQEFIVDVDIELGTVNNTPHIQLNSSCTHGWASHDRELSDGTMVFESGQLDGSNGMERQIGSVWVSCCVDRATENETPDYLRPLIDSPADETK